MRTKFQSTDTLSDGFTLVELAISLVVIGLLIGGVLKGRELIDNARVNTTIRQIRAFDAAANIFRDTYAALPGDIENPAERLVKCTTAICIYGGNGNSQISNAVEGDSGYERANFFPHLTKAGMIQGPEGGTQAQFDANPMSAPFLPLAPLSSTNLGGDPFIAVFYSIPAFTPPAGIVPWMPSHVYAMRLASKQAEALDSKMDDGKPLTGHMREVSGCVSGGATADYDIRNVNGCGIHIQAGF